jgi:peptidoglycan/LPS O-acetylase OafA/YrhL
MTYVSIQAGRGVAAALVVLFHLGGIISAEKYFNLPLFSVPFRFGSSGVDFFFVLSGFLITSVHVGDLNRPNRVLAYAAKRAVRIFPVYWIVFVAVYLAASLSPVLRADLPGDAASLIKALLLLPQDPAVEGGTGAPVLVVAWTLQYEMIFYVCLALVIVNQWLAVTTLCAIVAWWAAAAALGHPSAFPLHFLQWQFLVLFVMGAGVATLPLSHARLRAPWFLVLAGALAFLGLGLFEDLHSEGKAAWHPLVFGIASAVAIYGLVTLENERHLAVPRWMGRLGDASYALYLLHFPILSLLCKVAIATGLSGVGGASVAYVTILAVTIACAVVFNLYIEQPLLSRLRGWVIPNRFEPRARSDGRAPSALRHGEQKRRV